ncbi:unnamed protein product [Adineta ricciae]|uniref:Metallo-beta-lactamase domain-containing protein n=1 Tax=Adineta ricciae TaxID=249248 RepID=A0A816B7Z7_ADIRI|nr:unnamed protein product [Adineta ricciae]CAF1604271.1 unnamed protein product [Adineta ricciae]
MASAISPHTPNAAQNLDKNELYPIGSGFWNVRGRFKIFKVVDIETQMSIIQLRNGRFLVIDTVEMTDRLRQEIDQLTNNGEKIEAVIATHPFHTLSIPAFYQLYPKAAYYGTPRHLRRLTDIPWKGDLDDCNIRKKWEPDVEMRIPAGAEFVNPQPESSNHFVSVFVYHPVSKTLHVDDTIMYSEKPGFLLKLFGMKDGAMAFHPSIKSAGLHPTAEAPYLFRDWMRNVLKDWHFDNICCAHLGVKIGGAHADVTTLLNSAEPLFEKLSKRNQKKNPSGELPPENHPNTNVSGDECG